MLLTLGIKLQRILYGSWSEKTCLRGFAYNKDADQPAHLHSLFSGIVIHLLESTISKLATGEISIFLLVSVAVQDGLNLTVGNPKDRFCSNEAVKDR